MDFFAQGRQPPYLAPDAELATEDVPLQFEDNRGLVSQSCVLNPDGWRPRSAFQAVALTKEPNVVA